MLNKLDRWHRTKTGLLFFAGVELFLSLSLLSQALDTGSIFYYLLALVMLYGGLHNVSKFISTIFNERRKHGKR